MFKLTIRAETPDDLHRQINAFALSQGGDAKLELHAQVQQEQEQNTLTDSEWDAKHPVPLSPVALPRLPDDKPNGPKRGRPPRVSAKSALEPTPELEPEPEPDEIPPLDVLKQSITNAVIADKNPKGKVRTAVETLKPKLKVDFIAKCDETHRAALWAFVQETGIEVL